MSNPARAERERAPMVHVLEVDPDLGADLDRQVLPAAACELVAPLLEVTWTTQAGHWEPDPPQRRLGLLLLDGLLLREVRMLGTSSAELLGSGDLLRPSDVDGEFTLPLRADVEWTALAPLRVAALDDVFLAAACRYPPVLSRLMGRAVARAKALALHETVTNLKRVDTRLLVQFWHLAERWGRVGRDGVTIALPLTHELLAKLVGAQRPSVTTALGRLGERGQVVREASGWRLSHESRADVSALT